MVSDFITEKDGYLRLSDDEEYAAARKINPNIRMAVQILIEYEEARDRYWTGPKFMKQMESAVRIAEVKYPRERCYRLFWIFDQSGGIRFTVRMNAKEGGNQPVMHDTIYNGKVILMSKEVRKPLIDVLQQRGRYRVGMKVDDMRTELASHPDFKNEKNKVEY